MTTPPLVAPIARILLRVGVGYLIAKAILTPDDGNMLVSDPDAAMLVELALSGLVWAVTESWYALAKRFGWAT